MMNFTNYLDTLTLEQAREWDASNEKILYVDDDILGPANFRLTDARLEAVENKFDELLGN